MEPIKSKTEVRRSSRLALRRRPSADPNVFKGNETGVSGQKEYPDDGEIGDNDIIMETEAESEVKLEYDSTIESRIETSSASCVMDVWVEQENCQVVKIEPLENVLVEEERQRDILANKVPLIDGNLQQEQATECSSCDEHWCVWRKKFTEMQKKLEMVEKALKTVMLVLTGKEQDTSRSEDASRKKRPRMEDQLPVVVDEMVFEERLGQQSDYSHQHTSMDEALGIDQNQDSEDSQYDMTSVPHSNKVRRTRTLNLPDNTPSWLKTYYTSPQFPDLLKKDKVSALLPGVLQVLKVNWKDYFFDERYEKVNPIAKFELEKRDLLNCRLVCQAWKKSVDMNLCNDAFFEEYDWMDVSNFLTGPDHLGSPLAWNWKKLTLHSRAEKVLPLALNLNSSNAAVKFQQSYDSREPKVNPLLNHFLMLSGSHCGIISEAASEDYNIWYEILDRVGQLIWHLIIEPREGTAEDEWSECVVECLQRTPNLKTLLLFGVKTNSFEIGERVVHFPNLPQLRVIQFDGVPQTVMHSILQSNTQVERLGLCIRVHEEIEEVKKSVLIGDLHKIGLTKLTNAAVQILVEPIDGAKDCTQRALKEIYHMSWRMKQWPITKLDLNNMESIRIRTFTIMVRLLKKLSHSLTHLSIGNLSICERYGLYEEVIPLKEYLPKLEQMVVHLRVNVPKPRKPSRPPRRKSDSYSSRMKIEIPKNLKVMLIEVTLDAKSIYFDDMCYDNLSDNEDVLVR